MKKPSKLDKFKSYNDEHSRVAIPNMLYKDYAPMFISIVGPPRSGKTKLFSKIASQYTRHDVMPTGPLTYKTRTRRFTLYESTNSLENIIDTIKVSDLVILTVNLQVGLEKETLEAITMMNAHGQTKVLVIFTSVTNRPAKEAVMKRISQEFSFVVKFCDMINDNIEKITRTIELIKVRPIEWKCVHPHIIVDTQRSDYVYGYVRGGPIKNVIDVHVPGYGDYTINDIEVLEDPCELKKKDKGFYNPNGADEEAYEDSVSSEPEEILFEEDDIKLFDNDCANKIYTENTENNEISNENNEDDEILNDIIEIKNDITETKTIDIQYNNLKELNKDDLKELIKKKFRKTPLTEEDLIKKFEDEYSGEDEKEEKDGLNFLQKQKLKEIAIKEEMEGCNDFIQPGKYCRFKIDIKFNQKDILILGTYGVREGEMICLSGKAIKNKWQKGDLKSNAPYFVSMGWCRFQTLPIFSMEGRAIKYLRGSIGASYSEISFHGPSVPAGTGFFIFGFEARYRILATGKITDCTGITCVKKKLKLIGYPKRIMGNTAIIQAMFSSSSEVDKFSNAKLQCASGLRGILKAPIGHSGEFRATFEGTMLPSDVVFIKCLVPLSPVAYARHLRQDGIYIRSLKELKEEAGMALYEDDISSEAECLPVKQQCMAKRTNSASRIAELESKMPLDISNVKRIKESIDLPIAPARKKLIEEKKLLEQHRIEKQRQEQQLENERRILKEKKKAEEAEEKAERKRKNAVTDKKTKEKSRRKKGSGRR